MKELKRRLETFSFYDHTGIEKHLEDMAEKGWLLLKINRFTWVYRHIEPKKLHFAVTYYPKASEFDPEPQEGQLIYQDYSAHTGWKFICSSAQMQIFYNEEEEPIPMETDPAIEVQTIHKAAKKGFLLSYFILLAIAVLDTALFVSRLLGDPIGLLSSTTQLATGFCWALMFLLCVIELGGYYGWRRKAIKAAESGDFLDTRSHALFQKIILTPAIIALIYVLINLISVGNRMMLTIYTLMAACMITMIVVVNAVKKFMKRKKASRTTNLTVTLTVDFILTFVLVGAIVFGTLKASQAGLFNPEAETYEHNGSTWIIYQDELPLSVEDLQDVKFDGYVRENRHDESVFLGQKVVSQHPRYDTKNPVNAPEMSYTLTIIKMSALYDICKESILNKRSDTVLETGNIFIDHYEKIDAAPWLAEEAYQLHWSESVLDKYILCYQDRIIEIEFDWTPTNEQMRIVAEKLNPAN